MSLESKPWDVVILGAGIAGLEAALALARLGYQVLLLEKAKDLGGKAIHYTCKAIDGVCQQCGACLVADRIKAVEKDTMIVPMVETNLKKAVYDGKRYNLRLKKGEDEVLAEAKALVVSIGFSQWDPTGKKNLSYGRCRDIITGLELEAILRERGRLLRPSDQKEPQDLAFIQCVGSRDQERRYCSRVCCGYGIRMAGLIRSIQPQTRITFHYMDIQTYGRDFARAWKRDQEAFRFIRQVPGELMCEGGEGVSVYVKPADKMEEFHYDMAVLCCAMVPTQDHGYLADLLEMPTDRHGFLKPVPEKGLFVFGAASGPKGILDTILDVRSKIPRLISYLETE